MSSVDPSLPIRSVGESLPVQSSTIRPTPQPTSVDTGLSSIEKSKAIAALIVAMMNIPLLPPPIFVQGEDQLLRTVDEIAKSDGVKAEWIARQMLQLNAMTLEAAQRFNAEIEKAAELVREYLRSFTYYQQQLTRSEDQKAVGVAGVSNTPPPKVSMEHAQVPEQQSRANPSKAEPDASLSVLTTIVAAGGLALGLSTVISNSDSTTVPFRHVVELVEKLQPAVNQFNLANIIPVVNLMVMAPIYYHSWEEAISRLPQRERHNYMALAQKFAEDVIKMITDPTFINNAVITQVDKANEMDPELRDQMAAIIKFTMASIAISLLYSAEVGKIQAGKYWGMEPQEFRDLLLGVIPQPDPEKATTPQQRSMLTLLRAARMQLDYLPPEQRALVVEALFNFISENRSVDGLFEPAKVFEEVLGSITYRPPQGRMSGNVAA